MSNNPRHEEEVKPYYFPIGFALLGLMFLVVGFVNDSMKKCEESSKVASIRSVQDDRAEFKFENGMVLWLRNAHLSVGDVRCVKWSE